MVNENISVHLILWYYFLPIHKNNVNSEIINYTKLCKSVVPNILIITMQSLIEIF